MQLKDYERKKTMSLAKKCDICGKLYEQYDFVIEDGEMMVNGFILAAIDDEGCLECSTSHDCCPECMKRILNCIKNIASGRNRSKFNLIRRKYYGER